VLNGGSLASYSKLPAQVEGYVPSRSPEVRKRHSQLSGVGSVSHPAVYSAGAAHEPHCRAIKHGLPRRDHQELPNADCFRDGGSEEGT